jgi:hypothetical protein
MENVWCTQVQPNGTNEGNNKICIDLFLKRLLTILEKNTFPNVFRVRLV